MRHAASAPIPRRRREATVMTELVVVAVLVAIGAVVLLVAKGVERL